MNVEIVETVPYADQRPGTSGLRKKVRVFKEKNYLENFVQSIFDALPENELKGSTILVSGDGRYFNTEAIQIIIEIAAANRVKNVWIGKNGLVSTPAASAIIREREGGVCYGGIVLTASHNAGGPDEDFGIKYNTSNGGPAPASLTDKIFEKSLTIKRFYRVQNLPKIDLTEINSFTFFEKKFNVHVIDAVETWMQLMRNIFDFQMIKKFLHRDDFNFVYDGLNGVGGIYAQELFLNEFQLFSKKKKLFVGV